ncbi:MAG: hypothetical protein ACK5MP_04650 [Nostocoides sp.]
MNEATNAVSDGTSEVPGGAARTTGGAARVPEGDARVPLGPNTQTFDAPDRPRESATVAPAAPPPRWSGKKTAIVAALAIGFSSAGAIAAAAALPQSDSSGGFGRQGGPGGFGNQQGGPGGFGNQQGSTNQGGGFGNQQGGMSDSPSAANGVS